MAYNSLKDVSVLLIAPNFFGYDEVIAKKLEERGANLKRLADRPFNNSFFKALSKVSPRLISYFLQSYYFRRINLFESDFELILVINGQTISREMLKYLKNNNPRARLILYMWDSIKNRSSVIKNLDLFDTAFTFDKESADKFDLSFRPLFYDGDRLDEDIEDSYIASFIGTAHSDRYFVVKKILNYFSGNNTLSIFYLQAKWVYLLYKLTKRSFSNANIKEFSFKPISSDIVYDFFKSSNIIIDIEHPHQTGLTIRTFEAMRFGKKLITTNKTITSYDFYSYGNVYVVDRDNPYIPDEFIEKAFKPYSQEIYYHYSIDGWLDEVLNK